MSRHHHLIWSLSLCVSLLGCVADEGPSPDPSETSDNDDASAARGAVMAAIHADFLDQAVNGQANQLLVSHYEVKNGWAWVSATVEGAGGGEIDWSDSIYADDVEEGFFDGPHLEVLLRSRDATEGWSVDVADIGSTDLWFDGIWLRRSLPCSILPVLGDQCLDVSPVEFGTDERRAIMAAIHGDFLDEAVHSQANELVVSRAEVGGGYAFVTASIQAKGGGQLDWTDSDYAEDVEDGLFDGPHLEALLQKMDGAWVVVESDIGATDVSWWGAWDRHDSVPCALFPVDACE